MVFQKYYRPQSYIQTLKKTCSGEDFLFWLQKQQYWPEKRFLDLISIKMWPKFGFQNHVFVIESTLYVNQKNYQTFMRKSRKCLPKQGKIFISRIYHLILASLVSFIFLIILNDMTYYIGQPQQGPSHQTSGNRKPRIPDNLKVRYTGQPKSPMFS